MNFNFDAYSLLNTEIHKLQISIASNKTIREENTKFIELSFRGKIFKAKNIVEAQEVNKNL